MVHGRSPRPLLRALWLAIGLAVLAYGYFAYGPTGYRDFAADHGGALGWADRLLSEAGTASAAGGETTDLIEFIEDLSASPPPGDLDPPGFARWLGERLLFAAEGFASGPLRRSVTENAVARRQIAAVVEAARQAGETATSTESPAAFPETLDATFDRLETLFLESRWNTPEFQSFPTLYESRIASYDYWASFAILRAAQEGRGEAASQMLARYLESLRVLHQGQFPEPRVSFTVARRMVRSLSRIEGFPSDGLERARKVVQRIRLSAAEREMIRIAHALRWHDELLKDLDEERIPSKENAWGRLALGWPAKLTRKVFEPLQRRSADHIAKAWAENSIPFEARWRYILTPRHGLVNPLAVNFGSSILMNQDLAHYSDHYELERPVDDRVLDLHHGGRVRWLELALALSHFERDQGRPPVEIGQLVPLYLDPEFLEERDVSWTSGIPARAVWTIETVEGDRGEIAPVLCRWIRGTLRFREREGAIRPVFAWTADHLHEVRQEPLATFSTPEQPTSLEVVDLTLLVPFPP